MDYDPEASDDLEPYNVVRFTPRFLGALVAFVAGWMADAYGVACYLGMGSKVSALSAVAVLAGVVLHVVAVTGVVTSPEARAVRRAAAQANRAADLDEVAHEYAGQTP